MATALHKEYATYANGASASPYKYGGKEHISFANAHLLDFTARTYDPAILSFLQPDPCQEKYYPLSPYLYCAANPVNHIDPTGKNVAVLLVEGLIGHMGLLVQNENDEWTYYSFNGVDCPVGDRQIHDKGIVGGWKSPQEFLDSEYNRTAGDAGINDHDTQEVCNYNYTKAYVIETSEEQDKKIINSFQNSIDDKENGYAVLSNNCTIVVQKSLDNAHVVDFKPSLVNPTMPNHYNPSLSWGINMYTYKKEKYKVRPKDAYNYIKDNVKGRELKSTK